MIVVERNSRGINYIGIGPVDDVDNRPIMVHKHKNDVMLHAGPRMFLRVSRYQYGGWSFTIIVSKVYITWRIG